MNIITEKTVFGGNSIGKINGKTVFVPFSMPGEELEINIIESKRDYDTAEIVKILKPSGFRTEPLCSYYHKCGGCNMMHIQPDYQRELKKNMLCDIFAQQKINLEGKIKVVSGPDFNYRSRFQLNDGGLSERASNNIIRVKNCLCAETPVNEYLEQISETSVEKGRIHLFGSCFLEDATLNESKIYVSGSKTVEKNRLLGNKSKQFKRKENHYFAGTVEQSEYVATVCLGGKKISFDVRGFFQSNLFVFEKTVNLIMSTLPQGKLALDMYSGCGSISVFLADKFEKTVLVEHNRDAVVFAEKNLAGKNHQSFGLSGAAWVKNCSDSCGRFDACVVDPPRSGMEKEVCDYLCRSKIPYLRSLSCDPATHARDVAALVHAGYVLKDFYLLDFYPHTSHIESLAVLDYEA